MVFYDQPGAAGKAARGGARHDRRGPRARDVLSQLTDAPLDLLGEGLLQRGDHGIGRLLLAGPQHDLVAGLGRHLGDARPHDPRPNDANALDRHGRRGYRSVAFAAKRRGRAAARAAFRIHTSRVVPRRCHGIDDELSILSIRLHQLAERQPRLAALPDQHRIEREGREGGETAENARGQEQHGDRGAERVGRAGDCVGQPYAAKTLIGDAAPIDVDDNAGRRHLVHIGTRPQPGGVHRIAAMQMTVDVIHAAFGDRSAERLR